MQKLIASAVLAFTTAASADIVDEGTFKGEPQQHLQSTVLNHYDSARWTDEGVVPAKGHFEADMSGQFSWRLERTPYSLRYIVTDEGGGTYHLYRVTEDEAKASSAPCYLASRVVFIDPKDSPKDFGFPGVYFFGVGERPVRPPFAAPFYGGAGGVVTGGGNGGNCPKPSPTAAPSASPSPSATPQPTPLGTATPAPSASPRPSPTPPVVITPHIPPTPRPSPTPLGTPLPAPSCTPQPTAPPHCTPPPPPPPCNVPDAGNTLVLFLIGLAPLALAWFMIWRSDRR